jgi:hypothetical protein
LGWKRFEENKDAERKDGGRGTPTLRQKRAMEDGSTKEGVDTHSLPSIEAASSRRSRSSTSL